MSDETHETPTVDLAREDAHPRAQGALADEFFWDAGDPCSPFGEETGREVLEAFRSFRADDPRGSPLALLGELLARWEIADEGWDAIDADEVQAIGEADELGLLVRDEAVVALAFAQILEEGKVEPEVQRRALLALRRQSLPALIHGWGERGNLRRERVARMAAVLGERWA